MVSCSPSFHRICVRPGPVKTYVASASIDSLTKGILYGLGLLKSWSGTVALGTLVAREILVLCLIKGVSRNSSKPFNITTKQLMLAQLSRLPPSEVWVIML